MWIFNFTIAALLLWQWCDYGFVRESIPPSVIIIWVLIVANIVSGVLSLMT